MLSGVTLVISGFSWNEGIDTFGGTLYSLEHGMLQFLLLLLYEDDTNSYDCAFHMQGRGDLSMSVDEVSNMSINHP
jgi:hypothetical protein